jgi:predicted transcriptional regulator of viral defense system
MNTITLMKELERFSVFGVQEMQRLIQKDQNYTRVKLNRLTERGLVKRIMRNKYTVSDNIFVIATNLIYPSYLSFWSASSYKGFTDQILNTIQIATTKKSSEIEFENYRIEFIPISDFFGYNKVITTEGEIFVVDNEKLLIDICLRPEKIGNYDELRMIFEQATIDIKRLIEYLKRTNNNTLIKRVGYLLQTYRGIDISSHFNLDKNYVEIPFQDLITISNDSAKTWRIKR